MVFLYKCDKCDLVTTNKTKFRQHLSRKTTCEIIEVNNDDFKKMEFESVGDIVDEILALTDELQIMADDLSVNKEQLQLLSDKILMLHKRTIKRAFSADDDIRDEYIKTRNKKLLDFVKLSGRILRVKRVNHLPPAHLVETIVETNSDQDSEDSE